MLKDDGGGRALDDTAPSMAVMTPSSRAEMWGRLLVMLLPCVARSVVMRLDVSKALLT